MRENTVINKYSDYLMIIPALLMLFLLLVYPIANTLINSFSQFNSSTFTTGDFVGFKNYIKVFHDTTFWQSLWKTLIFLLGALPAQVIFGVIIALLLSVDWPGVKFVRALFIIPMVVTPVVAGSIWTMILDPLWGVLNSVLSVIGLGQIMWFADANLAMVSVILIDSWRWTPFIILMVLAGIVSLPQEPIKAAEVDGANWFQVLWHIKLPLLKPVIFSSLVVRWMGAVKVFDVIYITTKGGPGNATEVVNLNIYNSAFKSFLFDRAAVQTILLLAIILIITFILIFINTKTNKNG